MDILDQISDAAYREDEKKKAEESRHTYDFTFVFQVDDVWHTATFTGSISESIDDLEAKVAAHGADLSKIRYARAYRDDDGRLKVHPKTNSTAEAELLKVLADKSTATTTKR